MVALKLAASASEPSPYSYSKHFLCRVLCDPFTPKGSISYGKPGFSKTPFKQRALRAVSRGGTWGSNVVQDVDREAASLSSNQKRLATKLLPKSIYPRFRVEG